MNIWNALIFPKNEDKGKPLNPLLVKEVVVTKENQRTIDSKLKIAIRPVGCKRLLDLFKTEPIPLARCLQYI